LHYTLGIKAERNTVDNNLVLGVLLLGSLPSELDVLALQLHQKIVKIIFNIDICRDPHYSSDPIWSIIPTIFVKKLAAILPYLGSRGFNSLSAMDGHDRPLKN
jgi:hypothetical protein